MFDKPAAAITWEYRHILHKRHSKKHHRKWIWFVNFSFWNILEFWSNPELDGQGTFKRPSAITSNAPESCNRSSTLVGQIAGLDGMDLEKTTSDINQTNAPQKKMWSTLTKTENPYQSNAQTSEVDETVSLMSPCFACFRLCFSSSQVSGRGRGSPLIMIQHLPKTPTNH